MKAIMNLDHSGYREVTGGPGSGLKSIFEWRSLVRCHQVMNSRPASRNGVPRSGCEISERSVLLVVLRWCLEVVFLVVISGHVACTLAGRGVHSRGSSGFLAYKFALLPINLAYQYDAT